MFQILNTIKSVMMVRSELYCLNSASNKEHLLSSWFGGAGAAQALSDLWVE